MRKQGVAKDVDAYIAMASKEAQPMLKKFPLVMEKERVVLYTE